MRVAFRADASSAIGSGHVMRCLTLARALRNHGARVLFVCREHAGHLSAQIEEQGFPLHRLPPPRVGWVPAQGEPAHAAWIGANWPDDAEETISALRGFRPEWLIVDHYGIDARWEGRLRTFVKRIMAIDDLADRPHDCDVLLDQNLVAGQDERYRGILPDAAASLLGPAYALLQPDYARLRPKALLRERPVRRLFVFFGGVDNQGLTLKTASALLSIRPSILEADIVLSAASADFSVLKSRIAGAPGMRLHDRVPSLAPLMLAADLAVGAGGATSWERLCLGLPSLVVTIAGNQRPVASELSRRGLVRWLGDADAVDEATLRRALEEVIAEGFDSGWSERCFDVVDGRGVERVCAVLTAHPQMPLSVRCAGPPDEALLLKWANDPKTRQNAFHPNRISAEDHKAWFHARLRCPRDCVIYIAENGSGIPLGQVRFARHEGEWEISYSLAAPFRSRGLGRGMLAAAIEEFRKSRPAATLIGQVKHGNAASRRIFETLGFSVRPGSPDRYIYTRSFQE